jgi:DNA invertase Pin-like site-specific DNA recombinase
LLRDAKKKKFDAVIAKSVSRLGRNTIENLQTTHEAVLAEEESSKQSDRI